MRVFHFLCVCTLLTVSVMTLLADDSLDVLLQRRTLDLDKSKGTTLPAVLDELNSRYKARYGEALPVFISVALIEAKPERAAAAQPSVSIPGLEPPAAAGIDPAEARIGGNLLKVPIIEILRYYAALSGTNLEVRRDVVLFHPRK